MNISWLIWTHWDIFTDYVGWQPDMRIYAVPDDVQ